MKPMLYRQRTIYRSKSLPGRLRHRVMWAMRTRGWINDAEWCRFMGYPRA